MNGLRKGGNEMWMELNSLKVNVKREVREGYGETVKAESKESKETKESQPVESKLKSSTNGKCLWCEYAQNDCPKGPTGPPGRPGRAAPTGLNGVDGVPGIDGGSSVDNCNQFDSCITCPMGLQGEKGKAGKQGMRGVRGINGTPGCFGKNGQPGMSGEPGIQGEEGPEGDMGPRGRNGRNGRKVKSKPGEKGAVGLKGLPGMEGEVGERGRSGIQGQPGDIGGPGQPGTQGTQGNDGVVGETGIFGEDGKYCQCVPRTDKQLPETTTTDHNEHVFPNPKGIKNNQFVKGMTYIPPENTSLNVKGNTPKDVISSSPNNEGEESATTDFNADLNPGKDANANQTSSGQIYSFVSEDGKKFVEDKDSKDKLVFNEDHMATNPVEVNDNQDAAVEHSPSQMTKNQELENIKVGGSSENKNSVPKNQELGVDKTAQSASGYSAKNSESGTSKTHETGGEKINEITVVKAQQTAPEKTQHSTGEKIQESGVDKTQQSSSGYSSKNLESTLNKKQESLKQGAAAVYSKSQESGKSKNHESDNNKSHESSNESLSIHSKNEESTISKSEGESSTGYSKSEQSLFNKNQGVNSEHKELKADVHSQNKESGVDVPSQNKESESNIYSKNKESVGNVNSSESGGNVHSVNKESESNVHSENKESAGNVSSKDQQSFNVHGKNKVSQSVEGLGSGSKNQKSSSSSSSSYSSSSSSSSGGESLTLLGENASKDGTHVHKEIQPTVEVKPDAFSSSFSQITFSGYETKNPHQIPRPTSILEHHANNILPEPVAFPHHSINKEAVEVQASQAKSEYKTEFTSKKDFLPKHEEHWPNEKVKNELLNNGTAYTAIPIRENENGEFSKTREQPAENVQDESLHLHNQATSKFDNSPVTQSVPFEEFSPRIKPIILKANQSRDDVIKIDNQILGPKQIIDKSVVVMHDSTLIDREAISKVVSHKKIMNDQTLGPKSHALSEKVVVRARDSVGGSKMAVGNQKMISSIGGDEPLGVDGYDLYTSLRRDESIKQVHPLNAKVVVKVRDDAVVDGYDAYTNLRRKDEGKVGDVIIKNDTKIIQKDEVAIDGYDQYTSMKDDANKTKTELLPTKIVQKDEVAVDGYDQYTSMRDDANKTKAELSPTKIVQKDEVSIDGYDQYTSMRDDANKTKTELITKVVQRDEVAIDGYDQYTSMKDTPHSKSSIDNRKLLTKSNDSSTGTIQIRFDSPPDPAGVYEANKEGSTSATKDDGSMNAYDLLSSLRDKELKDGLAKKVVEEKSVINKTDVKTEVLASKNSKTHGSTIYTPDSESLLTNVSSEQITNKNIKKNKPLKKVVYRTSELKIKPISTETDSDGFKVNAVNFTQILDPPKIETQKTKTLATADILREAVLNMMKRKMTKREANFDTISLDIDNSKGPLSRAKFISKKKSSN
uniref:Collagen triple helix repeat protein n=1 Tax=Rhabditophanes sp. KR3021 TaxID=114890 RepID=A0AC35THP1_9BILA